MLNSFGLKITSGIFALFAAACLLVPMFIELPKNITDALNIARGIFVFLAAVIAIITVFLARSENIAEKSKDVDQFLQYIRDGSPTVSPYISNMYTQEIDEKHFGTLVEYPSRFPLATANSQTALQVTQLIAAKFPKLAGQSAQFRNNGYSAALWMGSSPPSIDFVRPLVVGLIEDVISDPDNTSAVYFLPRFFDENENDRHGFWSMLDGDVFAFLEAEAPGLLTRLDAVLPDIEQGSDSYHVIQWCQQVRDRAQRIKGSTP